MGSVEGALRDVDHLQSQVGECSAANRILEDEIQQCRADGLASANAVSAASALVNGLQNKLKTSKQAQKAAEKQHTDVQNTIGALNADIEKLRADYAASTEASAGLSAMVNELKTSLTTSLNMKQDISKQYADAQNTISALNSDIEQLHSQYSASANAAAGSSDELKQSLETLQSQRQDVSNQLADVQQELLQVVQSRTLPHIHPFVLSHIHTHTLSLSRSLSRSLSLSVTHTHSLTHYLSLACSHTCISIPHC